VVLNRGMFVCSDLLVASPLPSPVHSLDLRDVGSSTYVNVKSKDGVFPPCALQTSDLGL
jgi:hypothetical protein